MGDILRAIVFGLWPPMEDGTEPNRDIAWRRGVAVMLYLQGLMMLMMLAWLIGFLPAFVPVPAYSGSVDSLRSELQVFRQVSSDQNKSIRLSQLRGDLLNARKEHCLARGNQAGLELWFRHLQTLREEYQSLSGVTYDTPPCDAVLVGP